MTYARLRQAGAQITVTNQIVTELANDFSLPEHQQKAQTIMAEEIISKL
jgi:hypothetical protein